MTTAEAAEPLTVPATRGSCPFAPPPSYERAREQAPVTQVTLWDGSRCWMVTRHEDVRAVLSDPRFSSDGSRPGFPHLSAGRRALAEETQVFIRMDDPEHARLRRMLTADFMIKKVEAMRPEIQRIADDLLDRMTARQSQADFVAEFALPLPSLVICRLLGVSYEHHQFFQDRSRILLHNDSTPDDVGGARRDLRQFLTRLAEEKQKEPDEGIISRLVARGELTPEEVAATGLLLLVAGHETTANMTALSILALLRNPEQLARLRDTPSLTGGAVEELLRWLTIVHSGLGRAAVADVTIGGRTIRAGDGVLVMLNAANRDEQAFTDGAELLVDRDARHHVAFGFGVHQCLGQPLARLELQIALETVLRRLPGLELACSFEDVRFRHDMAIYGVHALPVAW
ncbi:cytochrome P450 [Streptacidiphilus sp. EB129]|uniref:cytochrome P450 n=1 Tax=Streptacidiphilus sp. EB129 TaxID=3156262 RepID=UPI003511CD3D